jgi:hypothetical protein
VIGCGIGRVLTPVDDPHGEGSESGSSAEKGEQVSQIISDKLIGERWMDGGGRDRSKEDRFDVVFGDQVWCLRQEDGIFAR